MNVDAILQRIAAGESQAYAQIVDHFQRPLFGYLARMGMSQAQAEDVAQETFVRAWTQLQRFQPQRGAFGTWLFTIARNLALNVLTHASRRHEVAGAAAPDTVSDDPGPAQALEQERRRLRVQAAVRRLPMSERSALALVYVHELSLADVARIEGDSVAAVKTRLHRARQRLHAYLQAESEKEKPS